MAQGDPWAGLDTLASPQVDPWAGLDTLAPEPTPPSPESTFYTPGGIVKEGGRLLESGVRGLELGAGRSVQFLGEEGQRLINALPEWMQGGRTRAEKTREVQRAGEPGKAITVQGLTHPAQTDIGGRLAEGLGNVGSFVLPSLVNPAFGAGALVAAGGAGVEDTYNRVRQETGSDLKATEAATLQIPLEALQLAPILHLMRGAGPEVASAIRRGIDGALMGILGPGSARVLGEVYGEQITKEDRADLDAALQRGLAQAGHEAQVNVPLFAFLEGMSGRPVKVPEPAGLATEPLTGTEPTPLYGSLPKEAVQTQGPLQLTEGAPRELPAGTVREPRQPAGPLPPGEQPITLGRSPSPKGPEEMTAGEVQLPGPQQGPPPRIIPQTQPEQIGERPRAPRPSIARASQDPALVEIAQRYVSGGERGKLDAREMLQDSLREFLTPQDIHDIASGPKEATAEPAAIPRKPPQEPPQPAAEPTANPSEMAANASTLAEPSGTEAPKAETAAAPSAAEPPPTAPEAASPTSTKNAATEAEREARGVSPLEATIHESMPETWRKAEEAATADPTLGERIVKGEAVQGLPREVREAVLLREKVGVQNEAERVATALKAAQESGDENAAKALTAQADAIEVRNDEIDRAAKREGTEWGRSGRIRQMLVNRDYSIASVESRFRASKGGPLTAEERARAAGHSERLLRLEKAVQDIEERLSTEQAQKSLALKPERRARVLSFLDSQAEQARARLAAKRGQAGGGLPFDPQDIADIARIAASHIAHGIDAGVQLVKDFGEAIRPHLEAIMAQARSLHRDAILGPQTGKAPPDVLGMRSALEDAAVSKLPEKGGAGQMLKTLENAGISSEEMEWSGIKDFLKGKLSVSKQEVLDYLKQSNVKVEEVPVENDAHNQRWALPGGENARTLLMTLARKETGELDRAHEAHEIARSAENKLRTEARTPIFAEYNDRIQEAMKHSADMSLPREVRVDWRNKRDTLEMERDSRAAQAENRAITEHPETQAASERAFQALKAVEDRARGSRFTGGHYPEPDVLAHLRVNDRTTADGKKMLFIEEVQSDWHQRGRREGYRQGPEVTAPLDAEYRALVHKNADARDAGREPDPADVKRAQDLEAQLHQMDFSKIPDAPFKKTWHELALKRAIRYAAENGYDSVGWTTGEQQAERYDLSKHIKALSYRLINGRNYEVSFMDKSGNGHTLGSNIAPEELADNVGKDVADKIISGQGDNRNYAGNNEPVQMWKELRGLDLKVGGEGMRGFYDKMLPAAAEKIGKVGGAKVEDASLRNEYVPPGNRAPQRFPDTPVHSLDITPALRTVATEQGFPRFGTEPAKASQPAILEFIGKQADAARLRIKERGPRAGALGDLAQMKDYAIIGADYLAKDVTKFADWSSAMLKEFGDTIKPHLQDIYDRAREYLAATPKQAGSEKAAITRATKTASKLRAKTAAQDFEPKQKPEPLPMTPERLKAKADLEEARKEFEAERERYRHANRTPFQKTKDVAKELVNIPKQIMTAYDMSAVLRQGGMLTLGRPIEAAKAFPKMFASAVSERSALETDVAIRNRPHAELGNKAGLELTQLEGPLYKHEEHIRSAWANKIPGIAGSNRAFTTFLNLQRSQAFDAMVDALPSGSATPDQAKAIANFVNVASGRGNPGKFAASVSAASDVLWSPRLLLSRFQLLAGQPLYRGDMATRKAIATQYARSLAGLAAVYALGKLAGGDIEDDPRSSDFGKIKIGNTRVDPLAGLAQVTVLGSRITTGETVNPEGKTTPLRPPIFGDGKGPGFGQSNTSDVLSRFLRTKLSPTLGVPIDVLSGKDVTGQPVTPLSAAENLAVPLSFSDILKAMEDQGIPKGIALGILSTFGMGVQTYQDAQPKPKKFKGLGMPRLR